MKTKLNFLKITLIGALFLTIAPLNSLGQTKEITDLINLYAEYGQFNGSVLVAKNGEVIYKDGFGMANFEWDIPNKPDTKHRLGSVTKQFTAMLILQLVEEGKLELHVPITKYLKDYPKENGNKITVHNLLTHTSGIPNYTSFPNFFKDESRKPYTPEEFIPVFSGLPLEFTPGERFAYSNSGYFLLGVIIEKVTGKSYEKNLQENIFTPLKMDNSGYDHHATILKNRATGYEKNGETVTNADFLDMSIPYAAGSLYSTVEDLYLWDQALYTTKLISNKSKELMFSKHINSGNSSYGYGWGLSTRKIGAKKDSVSIIEHSGGINGFNTIISRIPSDKHLVILLNNTGGTSLGKMRRGIIAILYNQPYDKPQKSLATELLNIINEEGLETGLKKFEGLKNSEVYSLQENEINGIGYQLLNEENTDAAIAIFKLNVNEFPESSNAYDSLGEAYIKQGDNEKAIVNYKKSVELNPNNTTGIDMLKTLGEDVSSLEKHLIISEDILKLYDGKYELIPNFILEISHVGNQLFLQATGQPKSEIFASTETEFYSKIVNAQITFNKDDIGKIVSLTLHQGGDHLAKKIE